LAAIGSQLLQRVSPRARLLLRGESAVASIGIAAAAIMLSAIAALGWWATRTQREHIADARIDHVRSVGQLLSSSAEVLLPADELSAVRRLVTEAAVKHDLVDCRIVLADGRVVAASDVSQVSVNKLPANWSSSSANTAVGDEPAVKVAGQVIEASFPFNVTGRGPARLEMTARLVVPFAAMWQMQTGIATVGAVSLVLILFVYRSTRVRLRAMAAVHEALGAMAGGEISEAVLAVSDQFGKEAQAWNKLLAERSTARTQSSRQRAAEVLNSRRSGRGDLDAAFDAMTHGIVLIDEKMRVKHMNGAAASFLRAKRESAVGMDLKELIEQPDVLESLESVITGSVRKKTTIEVERQGDQGSGVLRFSIRPVRREDSAAAMILIEDITQQRVAEESRNAFVAHATHELRTPLTNIRLYLETVMEEGNQDAAQRGKALNIINQEARRLERIVGEMLSVSEIEAGSLRIKNDDVRLDVLFDELKGDYAALAEDKQIALSFSLPPKLPVMRGDRDKIVMAMHNLIGNALKYTPKGGNVSVSVKADGKQLLFSVSDNGIGISEEDAERIFERFYRAKDPRVEKITGSGLGLTLAREVIRLHGGDVTVQSELNKGSTFTLTLPVVSEAA
jgi:PAS domain S-box-containing protein